MNEKLGYLREKARCLTKEPGVYIMRDRTGKIIYIGKAKVLRSRVSSYFRSVDKHAEKTYRMVQNVDDFDYIVTGSEFEALVLECSMIKQHRPRYNILLKDDKGYHYIRISDEAYPRISAEKQRIADDTAHFFGPYTSSFVVNQTVDELHKVFMLPTCTRKFPQDFRKARPCLNFHIKQCIGLCTGKIGKTAYNEIIAEAVQFIEGGNKNTVEQIELRMEQAAEALDFEKAARLRDRVRAIERISERQNVVFAKIANGDVVAFAQSGKDNCAVVLRFREQRLVDKQDFMLGEIAGLAEARAEFLLSFYSAEEDIPPNIALDGDCEDRALIAAYLTEKLGKKVNITVPERGEQLKFVQMAVQNASELLARGVERTGKEVAAVDELGRLLGLERPPAYIEAYDISNMGEQTVVGGMVVFENGRPLKSAYRKFNIKTVVGTDDYGSMREVISRRLARYLAEKDSGEGFGRLPDLILLDGGRGHVSAVQPIMQESGLNIPVLGMVKNEKHRTRAVAHDGGEIAIATSRSAFTLVSKIQDEVHRYAITHMKQRHTKTSFALELEKAPGIGEKRAIALLKHFKSRKAIHVATQEELAAAPGMGNAAAKKLYEFLHGEQNGGNEDA